MRLSGMPQNERKTIKLDNTRICQKCGISRNIMDFSSDRHRNCKRCNEIKEENNLELLESDKKSLPSVYIITSPQYKNWYKVGVSSRPEKRLGGFQIASPYRDYILEFSHKTSKAYEVEKETHSNFNASHEWIYTESKEKIMEYIVKKSVDLETKALKKK